MGTGNGNEELEWESGGGCKTGNDNQGCLKQGIRGVKRGIRGGQMGPNSRNVYLGKVRANKSLRRRPSGMPFKA